MSHPTDATNTELETASVQAEYEVTHADLPLSCPMPNQKLWNAHPRVYLPIDKSGEERCPYCGALYRLVD
jgi:uncharacterized Zn-finger protein